MDMSFLDETIQQQTADTNAFINKMSKDEIVFLIKCYKYLRVLGLVKNQVQFSEQYLCRSKDYMSLIQTTDRIPSIDCLHNLINAMRETNILYEGKNHTIENNINNLIAEGLNFITRRLLKYMDNGKTKKMYFVS